MRINTAKPNKGQEHRSKTDSYYTSRKHKSLREQAFIRDGGRCVDCDQILSLHTKRGNNKYMMVADHEVPRNAGGLDELDNIKSRCKPCHDKKSIKDKDYYK